MMFSHITVAENEDHLNHLNSTHLVFAMLSGDRAKRGKCLVPDDPER